MNSEEHNHDVTSFENERWRTFTQAKEFRHDAALALVEKGPILDIGCGDGLLLSLLTEKGLIAEGVDISDQAVTRCRERGLVAQVYDPSRPLPFPDETFESVTLLDVLEHVYDPKALLAEAARVSRSAVIIGVPNFSSLPARIQVLRGQVPENNLPHKGHVYWFNWRVLNTISASVGLRAVRVKMNTFHPLTFFGARIVRVLPALLALSFVVKYEKTAAFVAPNTVDGQSD